MNKPKESAIMVAITSCLTAFATVTLFTPSLLSQGLRAPQAEGLYNPVADPAATVVAGHARFSILTSQLIRMEWARDGHFEDHATFTFLNRRMPVPRHTIERRGNGLTLRTDNLTLQYAPETGDEHFTPANLKVSLTLNGETVAWRPGLADTGNLKGTARTLDGVRGDQTTIEPGLLSRNGWVLIDDSERPLFDSTDFRFSKGEQSPWPWVLERPEGERQDWYFFGYGHEYKKELGDFVRIAGRIPLPPRFAFGAWWSRYWAYSDQELNDLVKGFRANDVPLDVLVIDMDWHPTFSKGESQNVLDQAGQTKGWTGYSWNKLLFPDPKDFLAGLHAQGVKATLNLHPASGVQPWEDAYPAMAKAMGVDPATGKYIPFDITNQRFAVNYMKLLHHPLEKDGIDFWWLDWQQQKTTKLPGVNPTFWLNYVHFTDQEREGKRPLLFHRWGGLGNHRYQIGFSGDTVSVWESLAFQPWFTATAANVGYAYWSHDIGGHMPGAVEPELYLRWLQFGAFSPILRTHTTKNPDSERRIWAYPEPYSDAMREAFHLRYALLPYIYTEARRTYDTGVAFVRPLYYDWPSNEEAYNSRGQYSFGENLIVAPVTAPVDPLTGLAVQKVWLPKGEWVEWQTGKRLTGPAQVERKFAINQIPVYVPAGAILPMAPPMSSTGGITGSSTGQRRLIPLIVQVLPGVGTNPSTYTLYEDAGDSRAYQSGSAARTAIEASERAGVLSVTIAAARGTYAGMPLRRACELRLPGDWPPESVTVDGVPLQFRSAAHANGWSFEGNTLTTIIPVRESALDRPTSILVVRSPALVARRRELDGFAGRMTRLRAVYDMLRMNFPFDGPSDELVDALQAGDRLSYKPANASAELEHFTRLLPEVVAQSHVSASGMTDQQKQEYHQSMGNRWESETIRKRLADFNEHARRAAVLLDDVAPGPGDTPEP